MEEFYIKRNDKKVRKVRFKNENSIKEAFESLSPLKNSL